MLIRLRLLPDSLRGPQDNVYHGHVPTRARMLYPDAAVALLDLEEACGGLCYTDIYRSPEAQHIAHRSKAGTQRVAFSAHGYGLAVDLDLGASMRRQNMSYEQLNKLMEEHGWYCHRRDGNGQESEAWHFNWLGRDADACLMLADAGNHSTWTRPAECKILKLYGQHFNGLSRDELIEGLVKAHALAFTTDDVEEQDIKNAVMAFQKDWDLVVDGIAGPVTCRTLAYVTAKVDVAR